MTVGSVQRFGCVTVIALTLMMAASCSTDPGPTATTSESLTSASSEETADHQAECRAYYLSLVALRGELQQIRDNAGFEDPTRMTLAADAMGQLADRLDVLGPPPRGIAPAAANPIADGIHLLREAALRFEAFYTELSRATRVDDRQRQTDAAVLLLEANDFVQAANTQFGSSPLEICQ